MKSLFTLCHLGASVLPPVAHRSRAAGVSVIGLLLGMSLACSPTTPSGSQGPTRLPVGGFDNGQRAGTGAAASGTADNPGGRIPTAGVTGGGTAGGPTGAANPACKNLQCQQHSCPSGATTISGRVYDPAGKNPLYNIAVFVPNEAPQPITLGASCAKCSDLYTGKPVASALTDAHGQFILKDVPDGANIPLVIQVGKWRKQLTVPNVALCQDTAIPDKTLTLPRNRMEGDIPRIAISTGAADTLECLLRRVGVDAAEYIGGAAGDPRIHIFQGSPGMGGGRNGMPPNTAPAAPLSTAALWNTADSLKPYDILLLSCEGQETLGMNQQALHDYASMGGRVFASHFHYSWFNTGPYGAENLATWSTGSNDLGDISASIVTTFPKGKALQEWLMGTNALVNGALRIQQARHNADVAAANTPSQAWISADQSARSPGATQYFSFNTPTDAAMTPDGPGYCGRVVYSDLHVGAASNDNPLMSVPTSCADADLSPQEKALEFMLFDLSACVIPDDKVPPPPPILQ